MRLAYLEVNVNKYNPVSASSYIDLPLPIKNKKAVINVQNFDNACFAWAITSALRIPRGLAHRVSSYPHYSEVAVFDGVEFPVKLCDIAKFENTNNISLNVYGLNSYFDGERIKYEVVGPLHFAERKRPTHINLLLVSDDNGNNHYCWIKHLSRLVSIQKSKIEHQKYICDGCLIYFTSLEKLSRHEKDDCNHIKTVLPEDDFKINKYGKMVPKNIIQFENFEKQLKVPFVVYADFETMLKPLDAVVPNPDDVLDPNRSFTVKCCEHEPYSFAYYIKCGFDDAYSKLEWYRGQNAAVEFIQRIEKDVVRLYEQHLGVVKKMIPLTNAEKRQFDNTTSCHICDKEIEDKNDKVCDHDHLTGLYRGPAHMGCNLHYKIPKFIPIFFHNLTGYDAHLFIKTLALNNEDIDVIAQNKEKYISFSKSVHVSDTVDMKGKLRKVFVKLRFLDSFRFMAMSLEKLGANLDDDQCREVRKYFPDNEQFKLLRQKGVFPYSYVENFTKLNEVQLPRPEDFYDSLKDEQICEKDYKRAQEVWNLCKCATLGEYSDIYLKSDVLLLTDIFENFRILCLQHYKLDPAHYYTAPGLSWDAMLRMTEVKLELLTDVDMLHFFKKGMRGGVSMCSGRKAIANNTFLKNYDATKPTSFIMYLDATNLYGYAMREKLPTGKFVWLTENEVQKFDVNGIDQESEIGYVLEVDLKYPEYLHDAHNDLPFCAENRIPPHAKTKKLLPNLYNKSKYIIHYLNLKQCLTHGLEIIKIHRILKYQQSYWLRKYIDFNTHMRNSAKNEFEKDYYKLKNNSVFGKTMENVDNRVDIKLLTHWENYNRKRGAEVYVAKPNFKSVKIFTENLIAIQMSLVAITYNKPLYVGFCVLEISKTVLYDFYYNYIKKNYGGNASLLYTDTDSLIVNIVTENVYNDIKRNLNEFDTSNYPSVNMHDMPRNTSVLGKMKDEFFGQIIESFYGTGAKAYCVKLGATDDETDTSKKNVVKKAKGVKKYVIEKNLTVNDYKNIVEADGVLYKKMYVFRSHLHTMFTELKNKVVLSSKDDKRFVIPGSTNTLAWGHYKLVEENQALNELVDIISSLEQENPDWDFGEIYKSLQ